MAFHSPGRSATANLGVAALVCYAIHATFHLWHGRWWDLLWVCHLGAAVVGVGLVIPSAGTLGVGTSWLGMGAPLWVMDLAGGAKFMPTSLFTHVAALAIGLYGVSRLGVPAGTWWRAAVALAAVVFASRIVTPAAANVNVAFAVHPSADPYFSSHVVCMAAMLGLAAGYFLLFERALRRWLVPAMGRGDIS